MIRSAVVRSKIVKYALGTAIAALAVTSDTRSVGVENTSVSMTPKRARSSSVDGRPGGSKKQTLQNTRDTAPREMRNATLRENEWRKVIGRREKNK